MKDYKIEAQEKGLSELSTMPDKNIRRLSKDAIIEALTFYILGKNCILEIGCGNGYLMDEIIKKLPDNYFFAIDSCYKMIEIARKRNINCIFSTCSILDINNENEFDIVISERCLINLPNWEQQKQAIQKIYDSLKDNGIFILIEVFIDEAIENLDQARKEFNLPETEFPDFNIQINKKQFFGFIKGKFEKYQDIYPKKMMPEYENFLSTYYFARNVLYPALKGNTNLKYNNKFVEFFSLLPNIGDFSYLKMFVLQKIK